MIERTPVRTKSVTRSAISPGIDDGDDEPSSNSSAIERAEMKKKKNIRIDAILKTNRDKMLEQRIVNNL